MIRWFLAVIALIIMLAVVGLEAATLGITWLALICAAIGVVGIVALVLGVAVILTTTD